MAASGIIQVASVDLETRPVSLIAQGSVNLYKAKTTQIAAVSSTLPADSVSQTAVDVVVTDFLDNQVPDDTEIGITVSPVFVPKSGGGTIVGGTVSGTDDRIRIFTTSEGQFSFVYKSPTDRGPRYAAIQAATVNNEEASTGLLSSINIDLANP